MTRRREPAYDASARALAKRIVERDFAGNLTHAAKALGMERSGFTRFVDGRAGVGVKLIVALADYAGVSLDEVIGRRR